MVQIRLLGSFLLWLLGLLGFFVFLVACRFIMSGGLWFAVIVATFLLWRFLPTVRTITAWAPASRNRCPVALLGMWVGLKLFSVVLSKTTCQSSWAFWGVDVTGFPTGNAADFFLFFGASRPESSPSLLLSEPLALLESSEPNLNGLHMPKHHPQAGKWGPPVSKAGLTTPD